MPSVLILLIGFLSFTLLPGAWISFGAPLQRLGWQVRLALAVALSPPILTVQYIVLRAAGVGFSTSVYVLTALNLLAPVVVLRQWREWRFPRLRLSVGWALALFAILVSYLVVPWVRIPGYRQFSWHALMHTDIVYALVRSSSWLPEEPEIAGLTLSYSWAGHVYWAVLGWLTDTAPTVLYPLTNLVWLLVACVLMYRLTRSWLRLSQAMSLFSVGVMFLGTNVIGAAAWLWAGDPYRWRFYLGDLRYTPFLSKYSGFEVMPFAFALLIALVLVGVVTLQVRLRFSTGLITLLVASVALIYPILYPMALGLGGLLLILWTVDWTSGRPSYRWRDRIQLAAGLFLSVLVFVVYLSLVTQDRVASTFGLEHPSAYLSKGFHLVSAFLPLAILSIPAVVQGYRQRNGSIAWLVLSALALASIYVVVDLRSLDYKYVLGVTIVLAPLGAAGFGFYLDALTRLGLPLLNNLRAPAFQSSLNIVATFVFLGLHLALMYRTGALIPKNLHNAPSIDEGSFWIHLSPDEEDAAWVRVVLESTPPDAVVLSQGGSFHLGPFVERSLYMPADENGESTAGYSISNRLNLLVWRGYSEALFDQRLRTVETIFGPATEDLGESMQALADLNRPVVIHFRRQDAPGLLWLQDHHIGMELYADASDVLWYVDEADLQKFAVSP